MRRRVAHFIGTGDIAAGLLAATSRARAQEPGEQAAPQGGARGQFAGAQRVAGEVVSVSGANVTIKSIENGQTVTVVTTTNTRLMKGPGEPLVLTSLKPGDGVVAMGQLDAPSKSLHAMMVMGLTADQTKQMEQAATEMKANLGKTYITGKVTAVDIDNLKMTVQRPDGQSQTIGFDEGTSFKKGGRVTGIGGGGAGMGGFGGGRRGGNAGSGGGTAGVQGGTAATSVPAIVGGESITLADIQEGDNVVGLGSVKGGTFVPTTLNLQVRGEGPARRRGGPDAQGAPAGGPPQPAPTGPSAR